MTQIGEGVYFIQGQDEFIPDSHTYIVGKSDSRDLTLIDPGLMGKGTYKVQSIVDMGIELASIKRILMTHIHLDHIGCLAEVREQIPWAELWVHEIEAKPLEEGDERAVYGMEMFRSMCQMQYNLQPGAFTFKVDRKLEGNENLELGGMSWELIHVPGHSPGSVGLYYRSEKTLIPGDVVYADYAIGRFDLHGANGTELKNSLMRLGQLEVDILLPGHNRIVKDLPPGYIGDTARQWAPYLT
jgi:glyoxylase-like metal-dependent hydrolase (beta-lactamase superfamily II)